MSRERIVNPWPGCERFPAVPVGQARNKNPAEARSCVDRVAAKIGLSTGTNPIPPVPVGVREST